METQYHGHEPEAPAWYMSVWFLLVLILVIALLTIWITFARNTAAQEQQVQSPVQSTAAPVRPRPTPPATWAFRTFSGWAEWRAESEPLHEL